MKRLTRHNTLGGEDWWDLQDLWLCKEECLKHYHDLEHELWLDVQEAHESRDAANEAAFNLALNRDMLEEWFISRADLYREL